MIKLVLFDIDGTLVLTGGAGGRAMAHAAQEVFGVRDGLGSISMAGRTDSWIVAQMAADHGVAADAETLSRFHHAYVSHLLREITAPGHRKGVLPGVQMLLETLAARVNPHMALLTGNFRRGAQIKLEHFDLWRFFRSGAFGDRSSDRNALLGAAIDHVAETGGPRVLPAEVIIVGDTPLDVAVAVAGGARSLGVATGPYDARTLRESGADVVLEDLSDQGAVLAALGVVSGPE